MTAKRRCTNCGEDFDATERAFPLYCRACESWFAFKDADRNPVGPGGMVVVPDTTPRHRTRGGVGAVGRKMRRGK